MAKSDNTQFTALLEAAALDLPPEKKFYFNGFTLATSPMDCAIVLNLNNQPVAFLNTTHVVAKTLVAQLGGLLAGFEEKTGQQVLRVDELQALLLKDTDEH